MKILLLILSLISIKTQACSNININIENDIQIWLGKNSEFSKKFNKSKCILDKELEGLSIEKKN